MTRLTRPATTAAGCNAEAGAKLAGDASAACTGRVPTELVGSRRSVFHVLLILAIVVVLLRLSGGRKAS
jgi:hypothetical protein